MGWPICSGPQTIYKSPPIVNGPAHKNLLSRAFEEHRLRGSCENSKVLIPRCLHPADSSFAIVSASLWHVATLFHCSLTIGGKEHRSVARKDADPLLQLTTQSGPTPSADI